MNNLKGVLRSATAMFLFVGFFGLLVYADETREQKVERLIKELQDEDSGVRVNAAWALGEIGAVDAVPALIPLLQDKVAHVRVSAAMALGQIGSEDAVPALIQALKDRDDYVSDSETGALGEIGTPEALKAVEEYQSP